MTPREARDAARRKLGNITLVREDIYQMNTVSLLDSAWRDLKYGARLLRLSPGFAIVAILSLALGVGANTAIFQLLDAVRLRTLPVKDPQQLVEVRIADTPNGRTGAFLGRRPMMTNPLWEQLRDRQQAFSGVFAWGVNAFNLTTGGEARYAQGLWVSGDFFNTLGVTPLLGRTLDTRDEAPGSDTVVISAGAWQRYFQGNPAIIGRTVALKTLGFEAGFLDGTPLTIVGVMPREFDFPVPYCDYWAPITKASPVRSWTFWREDRRRWCITARGGRIRRHT